MPYVIAFLIYLGLIALFFQYVAPLIFVVTLVGMAIVVVQEYSWQAWRVLKEGAGPPRVVEGPEPAYTLYFHRQAYRDYQAIVTGSYPPIIAHGARFRAWADEMLADGAGWLTWPLWVTLMAVLVTAAVGGAVFYAVVGALHLTVVLLLSAASFLTAYTLRLFELLWLKGMRIFLACPSTGCHQKVRVPVVICPTCGAEHRHLLPGLYGTFQRRCACNAKLPTLYLNGRHRLPCLCPHCSRPLSVVLARNLHVAVVGGPSAGKTCLLTASLARLAEQAREGLLTLELPEEKDRRLVVAAEAFLAGAAEPTKTAQLSPDAFLADLTSSSGTRRAVYVYDGAGEAFQQVDALRGLEYYRYIHGLVFVIDPFSLSSLMGEVEDDTAAAARPSEEPPQAVYDRMVATMRELAASGSGLGDQPFAVVVSKADACGLVEACADAESTSDCVRSWLLQHQEGNLVRCIEREFRHVRYFATVAGASTQAAGPACDPLAPFRWILEYSGFDWVTRSIEPEAKAAIV